MRVFLASRGGPEEEQEGREEAGAGDGGSWEEAIARLDRHDVIYGETPESAYLRGRAHQAGGDKAAAKQAFLKAQEHVVDSIDIPFLYYLDNKVIEHLS